jgi:hypothetical protein
MGGKVCHYNFKMFALWKTELRKGKDKPQSRRRIFAKCISDERPVSYIRILTNNNEKTTQIFKWEKDLNRLLHQRRLEHVRKYLASVIREM